MKKAICIIVYSPICQDARVLRQIAYLAPHYRLTVIAFGAPHPSWEAIPDLTWRPLARDRGVFSREHLPHALTTLAGLLGIADQLPALLEWTLRSSSLYAQSVSLITAARPDAVLANDHDTLPAACAAADALGCRLVFDAHEHAPSLFDDNFIKQRRHVPLVKHILTRCASRADAVLTVAPAIAERYRTEFGLDPQVVLNAPEYREIPDHAVQSEHINLVHHGVPLRDRRLDRMIDAVAAADARFHLHFMLTWENRYLAELKAHAAKIAPNRVTFHPPVPPEQVVARITEYDLGIHLLNPSKYNNIIALPNKFFDFIGAGLPALVGPSPSMEAIVREHGCGWVSPSFTPADTAVLLNRLTVEEIRAARARTREAARVLNAGHELVKVVALFARLLDSGI